MNFTAFVAIFLVSLLSLVGVVFLSFQQSWLRKTLMYFVSFAVGALFANVFFHLLPEVVAEAADVRTAFAFVLLGILVSFVIEKFIHWHHCHNLDCEEVHSVGIMMLIGDGVHNIVDGVLIAAAFLVDVQLGWATTLAIILHEIPQEIGDFAVLIHSGFSRRKALLWNFLSALTALVGGAAVMLAQTYVQNIPALLLPIAAGNFLYIAGSDLIPELHKEPHVKKSALQFTAMLAGIALMYTLTTNTPEHGHGDEQETYTGEHGEHEIQAEEEYALAY